MSRLFNDSFDNVDSQTPTATTAPQNNIALKYTILNPGNSYVSIASNIPGMTNNCLALNWSVSFSQCTRNVGNSTKLVVGANFKPGSMPQNGTFDIFQFQDSGSLQTRLYYDSAGILYIKSGNVILAQTTANVINNSTNFVEFETTFNTINGSVKAAVNGVTVCLGNGITSQTLLNSANQVVLCNPNSHSEVIAHYFDDLYINDGTGGSQNDFDGPRRILCYPAIGNGQTVQWTPTGAANNWSCVTTSNPNPDADTTYNSTSTVNNVDLFTLATLDASVSLIEWVQHYMTNRSDGGGGETIGPMIGNGVASGQYGGNQTVAGGYVFMVSQLGSTNPLTASNWVSDFNTLQIGYKRLS